MYLIHKQCGTVLPATLWLASVCMIIAVTYTVNSRTEIKSVTNISSFIEMKYAAKAGIYLAIDEMLTRNHNETAYAYQYTVDKYLVYVNVDDESEKLPVNTASEFELLSMMKDVGVMESLAYELTHKILDYRDVDGTIRSYGAEDEEYRARGLRYGSRDGALKDLVELKYIGITDLKILSKLSRLLTIYPYAAGRVFSISSSVTVPGSEQFSNVKAIVQLTGSKTHPYRMLDWSYGEV